MRALMIVALLAQAVVHPGKVESVFISPMCERARADAIERVREAWAPRFSSHAPSWSPNLWGNQCASKCLSVTTTGGLPHDDSTSADCYRCLADAKDARDKAAKERAEKEERARAALDAVDEACGINP